MRYQPLRLFYLAALTVGLLSMQPQWVNAQEIKIEIDHKEKTIKIGSGATKPIEPGKTMRVDASKIEVTFTNTNTAFYTYSIAAEDAKDPELAAFRSFLTASGGFLPDLLGTMFPGDIGVTIAMAIVNNVRSDDEIKKEIEESLATIPALIEDIGRVQFSGSRDTPSLQGMQVETLNTLYKMVASPDKLPMLSSNLSEEIGSGFSMEDGKPPYLTTINTLMKNYLELSREIIKLQRNAATLKLKLKKKLDNEDKIEEQLKNAYDTLSKAEKVLALAHDIETIALAAMTARTEKSEEPIEIGYTKGKTLSIKVAPKSQATLARLADLAPLEFKITVLRKGLIRPSVSVALLTARGATFDEYGTKASGEQFEIVTPSEQNSRFSLAINLSLTPKWLDWREKTDLAVWLPEVYISPDTDIKSIGGGFGLSYRFLKLSLGLIWFKHTALIDAKVGDFLDEAGALRTRKTYGDPEIFFGLSILPNFLQ